MAGFFTAYDMEILREFPDMKTTKFVQMRERQQTAIRKFAFGGQNERLDLSAMQASQPIEEQPVRENVHFLRPEIIGAVIA